jgi:plasmid stability protein
MAKSVLPIRLDAGLKKRLTAKARASGRTVSEQVRYYALLAMLAEENPDLPLSMIQDILEGREQAKQGLLEPYPWGVL